MRFEYAKFNAREIERRIRAEEARTGRRVEKVILTPSEWERFEVEGLGRHVLAKPSEPSYRRYRIPRTRSLSLIPQSQPWDEFDYIDVVCEGLY